MEFSKHYLDYEEYRFLGGTLREAPFNILELEAQKQIDKYTSGRLKDFDDQINEVKICSYRLINLLQSYVANNPNKSVISESIDGYSVNYGELTQELLKSKAKEIQTLVRDELAECCLEDGTPYIYVGVN